MSPASTCMKLAIILPKSAAWSFSQYEKTRRLHSRTAATRLSARSELVSSTTQARRACSSPVEPMINRTPVRLKSEWRPSPSTARSGVRPATASRSREPTRLSTTRSTVRFLILQLDRPDSIICRMGSWGKPWACLRHFRDVQFPPVHDLCEGSLSSRKSRRHLYHSIGYRCPLS